MPCRDDYPSYNSYSESEYNRIKERLDRVTAHLCFVMHYFSPLTVERLVKNAEKSVDGKGLGEWWTEHQEADHIRQEAEREREIKRNRQLREEKAAEKLRENARKKLTKKEQIALGIHLDPEE